MAPRLGAVPDAVRSLSDFAAAEARSIRESTLPSSWPLRLSISSSMWCRSQGAAANCTRWVCSWRQTQSRKSSGSTLISRSTEMMFGATRSSRPAAGAVEFSASAEKGSYWPRTLLERKARMAPSWLPVMAPLTLAAPGFRVPRRPSSIFSIAGWSMTAKLWVLALAQEARSTTRTEESRRSRAASRPVMSWTCGTEMSAMSRRLSTAAPISADPRVGPAGVRRAAVEAASSQLIRAWAWADVSRAEDSIGSIRSQGTDIAP